MAEHEKKTQKNQEQGDRKHRVSQQDSQPLFDQFHTWEQGTVSIAETPFWPRMDQHAALLAGTRSDEVRANLVLQLQRTYGNRYVQRLVESVGAEGKLTVSPPNDIYEQEADTVAEKVVNSVNSQAQRQEEEKELQSKPVSEVQRQEEEGEEEEELIMMKADEGGAVQLSETIEALIEAARAGGEPLPDTACASLEPILGHDFSGVRVHTDAKADKLSRQLEAEAFTTGRDIFFREGAYQPDSLTGKGLLAHELTHVVQQAAASVIQRQGRTNDDENRRALASSSLPRQVRRIGLGLISGGQRLSRPDLEEYGREFLRTGQLKLLSQAANVMVKPQFLGPSVQSLRRGERVTVLDTHGAWYLVRTEEKKEGFVHSNNLIPQFIKLRPGETGSGSTRGETEIGGRG